MQSLKCSYGMTSQYWKILQKHHCPFKQMFQGKGCLKILDITPRQTPLQRCLNTDSPKRFWCNILATFLANTFPVAQPTLWSVRPVPQGLQRNAHPSGVYPEAWSQSWTHFSPHQLCTQGRDFLLLCLDNEQLHQADKAQMSFVTGSFKPLSIFTTLWLNIPCSTLARSCLEARACGWQSQHCAWRDWDGKLSPLTCWVLGTLLGRAPEPQACSPLPKGKHQASGSALRLTVSIHLTPTHRAPP